MADSWTLTGMELRGYLGVGEQPLRVDFDRPLVILAGCFFSLEGYAFPLLGVT